MSGKYDATGAGNIRKMDMGAGYNPIANPTDQTRFAGKPEPLRFSDNRPYDRVVSFCLIFIFLMYFVVFCISAEFTTKLFPEPNDKISDFKEGGSVPSQIDYLFKKTTKSNVIFCMIVGILGFIFSIVAVIFIFGGIPGFKDGLKERPLLTDVDYGDKVSQDMKIFLRSPDSLRGFALHFGNMAYPKTGGGDEDFKKSRRIGAANLIQNAISGQFYRDPTLRQGARAYAEAQYRGNQLAEANRDVIYNIKYGNNFENQQVINRSAARMADRQERRERQDRQEEEQRLLEMEEREEREEEGGIDDVD